MWSNSTCVLVSVVQHRSEWSRPRCGNGGWGPSGHHQLHLTGQSSQQISSANGTSAKAGTRHSFDLHLEIRSFTLQTALVCNFLLEVNLVSIYLSIITSFFYIPQKAQFWLMMCRLSWCYQSAIKRWNLTVALSSVRSTFFTPCVGHIVRSWGHVSWS